MADPNVRTFGLKGKAKVEFSMTATQKHLAEIYAEAKGFMTASRLAPYAVLNYMAKNPLSRSQRAQVEKIYGAEVADAIAPAQPAKEGE